MGVILDVFSLLGKIPVSIDVLKIRANGTLMSCLDLFSILIGQEYNPYHLLGGVSIISFSISS